MKKKILIGSIFAVLLLLSMPVMSNIQAQPVPAASLAENNNGCSICPECVPECSVCDNLMGMLNGYYYLLNRAQDNNAEGWVFVYDQLIIPFLESMRTILDCSNRCP